MSKDMDELISKIKSTIFSASSSSDPYDPRNVDDTDVYKTNVSYPMTEKSDKDEKEELPPEEDQQKEPVPDEEAPQEDQPTEEMPPEEGGEMDPSMDPAAGGEMDPNSMGAAGEEPPKDPVELGKIYELKKIYSRLVSIESYLTDSSDTVLLKLRNYVSQAIELFETLAANIKSYTDKLDDIIITFYEFIEMVYKILKIYYDRKRNEK